MKTVPKTVLLFLFLLWMLPGLIGRDPWKADEPYSFGMTTHIMRTGDVVVPAVAGVPFLEKPPLYYAGAAISGSSFSSVLPLHDAVRIFNIAWMAATMLFLSLATRETVGAAAAWSVPFLLMSCTLLLVPVHKLITDVALLTGFAIALYGLALTRRRPGRGGFWTGTGAGIGFLAKGLFAPGMIAITSLALPALFPAWRKKGYALSLAIASLSALPWLAIWPAALYLRSRDYFIEWFWYQNLGRFLGFARVGGHESHAFSLINLPWLAWPVLPLALWTLWRFRANWREHPVYQLPLIACLAMLAVLTASASARYLYVLPLLLPIIMLAAAGVNELPERAASIIGRTGAVLFSMLALALWLGWLARAAGMPFLAGRLPLSTVHYRPFDVLLFAAALVLLLSWLAGVTRLFRRDTPFPLTWAAGTALVWGLAMTLWLPWMEGETSFREVFTSLRSALPVNHRCVASYGIGESERAMLEYYAGIQVQPLEFVRCASCDVLVVGRGRDAIDPDARDRWQIAWDGVRPAEDPKEQYTLYRLSPASGAK